MGTGLPADAYGGLLGGVVLVAWELVGVSSVVRLFGVAAPPASEVSALFGPHRALTKRSGAALRLPPLAGDLGLLQSLAK